MNLDDILKYFGLDSVNPSDSLTDLQKEKAEKAKSLGYETQDERLNKLYDESHQNLGISPSFNLKQDINPIEAQANYNKLKNPQVNPPLDGPVDDGGFTKNVLMKGVPGVDPNLILNPETDELEQWTQRASVVPSPLPTPAPIQQDSPLSNTKLNFNPSGSVGTKVTQAGKPTAAQQKPSIDDLMNQAKIKNPLDEELFAAQQLRQGTVNSDAMIRAANNIGRAMAYQTPDNNLLTDVDNNAGELIKDVLSRREEGRKTYEEQRKKMQFVLDTEKGKVDLNKAQVQLDDLKSMDDAKSDISKAYRETVRSRFKLIGKNVNIPENMSASMLSKLYPTTDLVDDFIKLKGVEERMLLTKQMNNEKLDEKDHRRLDQAGKLIESDLARNNTAFGRNANIIRSADAIETLVAGKDPAKLTNPQLFEIAKSLDAMLSAGAVTQSGTEHLMPAGWGRKYATISEFITNNPAAARQSGYVKQALDTVAREKELAKNKVTVASKSLLASYQDLAKKQPEAWNAMLQLKGLDPNIVSLSGGQKVQQAPSPVNTAGKIKVSNGKETLLIDPSDLEHAKHDGYKEVK